MPFSQRTAWYAPVVRAWTRLQAESAEAEQDVTAAGHDRYLAQSGEQAVSAPPETPGGERKRYDDPHALHRQQQRCTPAGTDRHRSGHGVRIEAGEIGEPEYVGRVQQQQVRQPVAPQIGRAHV